MLLFLKYSSISKVTEMTREASQLTTDVMSSLNRRFDLVLYSYISDSRQLLQLTGHKLIISRLRKQTSQQVIYYWAPLENSCFDCLAFAFQIVSKHVASERKTWAKVLIWTQIFRTLVSGGSAVTTRLIWSNQQGSVCVCVWERGRMGELCGAGLCIPQGFFVVLTICWGQSIHPLALCRTCLCSHQLTSKVIHQGAHCAWAVNQHIHLQNANKSSASMSGYHACVVIVICANWQGPSFMWV